MKYITKVGTQLDAFEQLHREGGQLYTSKHSGGSSTLVQGKRVTTFWPEDSTTRIGVIRLATEWNLNPEHMTYGRLAKWYIQNILELPHEGTYSHYNYANLAKDGYHWHYLYYKPGDHGYCFEWDLKSAYVASLLKGKSLLYDNYKGYLPDGGALEALGNSVHLLPKDFRLVLVGVLSTHRRTFWVSHKVAGEEPKTSQREMHKIVYGAAFNATHGAIYRLYCLMRKLHDIGGEWIVRCHTDSVLIKADIPHELLTRIAKQIQKEGHQITVKAEGRTYLFDIDLGFIGNKPLGGFNVLKDSMRTANVTLYDAKLGKDVTLKWQDYKKGIPADLDYQP